ncbi:MAG: bifunctional phosphopantothenoylcysteine decarboxylase/phosphopantothenate--cysteine ligase CoaBC [Acidimicrobiia bacterium]|nr:bifunctional phosphopantothenoylcysteine decarboxylase/phosphopantothenate--cysteine ligase CoaBC [Acidimicrobiia bacterium]
MTPWRGPPLRTSRIGRPALHGRHLVLGISGGIAAYKTAYLARRLQEAGSQVRTVMTGGALRFLGEQTMAAINGHPVVTTLFGSDQAGPSPHTELARWADALVVAPATANVVAKVANGLADDALTATVAAFDGPVVLAPAMHTEMWQQPATARNIRLLEEDGRCLVGPVVGELAAGDSGMGRMAEPDEILAAVAGVFDDSLSGLRVLVTAGGTREAIDPVRYVGNRSSGKMGHEVALEAARRGAGVVLVTTTTPPDMPGSVEVVQVESAEEMAHQVWARASTLDVAVMAAAVADFRPAGAAGTKLARSDGPPRIVLEPTPNVLAGLVERVEPGTTVVGFAAETGSVDRAVRKATTYGVDFVVANDVTSPGSGFGTDTNQVTIISAEGERTPLEMMTKRDVAGAIWSRVTELRGSEA